MKTLSIIWDIIGVLYLPIYLVFWLLTSVVRFMLAICYAGMLDFKRAKSIILATFHGYDPRRF